jgi:hypothetical protein
MATLKLIVLVLVVAAAAAVLLKVFAHGLGRPPRLQAFAAARGGTYSAHDDFDLQSDLDALFDGDAYPGHAAALDDPDGDGRLYLVELHPEPAAAPRRTAVLLSVDRPNDTTPLTLRARLPSSADADAADIRDRFDIDPDADPPDDLLELLDRRTGDLEWLPELRLRGDQMALVTRDRLLADADEWEQLIDLACASRRTLRNNHFSGGPAASPA